MKKIYLSLVWMQQRVSYMKSIWDKAICAYREVDEVSNHFWSEVVQAYSGKGRFYHNTGHLELMFRLLTRLEPPVGDINLLRFSIFYHDVIYDPTSRSNEVDSAQLAVKRLRELGIEELAHRCGEMITSTASHQQTGDQDTDLLLDLDIAILGMKWEEYSRYMKDIRREYAMYGEEEYKQGRKRVLEGFLSHPAIFNTATFRERYETRARENLTKELNILDADGGKE